MSIFTYLYIKMFILCYNNLMKKIILTNAPTINKNYVIEARNLTKTFKLSSKQRKINHTKNKTLVAVNNLSFKVAKGEIYGLLGPNGAGKTTTLRLLSNLIYPDEGNIFINGVSIVEHRDDIIGKIGFLTSELKLEDFFTPSYLFNFFGQLHNISETEIARRKDFLFAKFGIDKFAEVKVSNLSTGMKQKLSIAISLIHNPDIIIFDEPTNGLDILTAKAVTDFLFELKQEGKTIIISTHIFRLAETLCDKIGIIIDGKMIVEEQTSILTKDMPLENVFYNIYKEIKGDE